MGAWKGENLPRLVKRHENGIVTDAVPDSELGNLISCHCKLAYPTKSAAKKVAKQKRSRFGNLQRAYYCKVCFHWHLTSRTK